MHLNPRAHRQVHHILDRIDNVLLLPPLSYLEFVFLMQRVDLIISDSGGIQEEAPYLGVPVLVTRDRTDRPESINAGLARLVGPAPESIVRAVETVLTIGGIRTGAASAEELYGDGESATRIVQLLEMFHAEPLQYAETDALQPRFRHLEVSFGAGKWQDAG